MKFSTASLSAILSLGLILTLSVSCHHPETEAERIPRDLNKTLTNEMSDSSDLAGMDKNIRLFMQQWNLQGLSLSIMRNDSLVYAKGYGWADGQKKEK